MRAMPELETFIRWRDLPGIVGHSHSRLKELIREGSFPKPIQIGEKSVAFLSSDIAEWQQQKIKAARRQAAS
jgi:prophage regulatory protein